jgi:hypothetical protein
MRKRETQYRRGGEEAKNQDILFGGAGEEDCVGFQ